MKRKEKDKIRKRMKFDNTINKILERFALNILEKETNLSFMHY